jgi:NHLM bacteriocin system ABC transporter peptidase/ATP-binding protein
MRTKRKEPKVAGVARVPLVMQLDSLEGGAAALAMVLAYYGKWLPIERVRQDCGIGRDGVQEGKIVNAAIAAGMDAGIERIGADTLKARAVLPCIISWEKKGYAVLCGYRGANAVVNDPKAGRLYVAPQAFAESYDGICMTLTPTADFIMEGTRPSMMRFALNRLKGNGSVFILVALLTLILTIIAMVNPAFASVFVDEILVDHADWLYPFLALLLAFGAVQVIVELTRSLYLLKMEAKFAVTSNSTFIWHVLRLPMDFFATRQTGDVIERAKSNENLSATIMTTLAPMVLNLITLVLYVLVVFRYSPLLSAIGLSALVTNLLLSQAVSRKRVNIARMATRGNARLTGITISGIEMMETIKTSGAENGFFQRWSGQHSLVNDTFIARIRLDQSIGVLPGLITSFANIAMLLLGIWLIILGEWSVGMVLAFQGYFSGVTSSANKAIAARATIQEMRADVERVEDVMGCVPDVEFSDEGPSLDQTLDKLTGRIELKNVTFGYSKQAPPLIEDFSLSIEPGDKIAFVGFSGCGKSTLSKLISGLYQPWSGEILFDGKPRQDIPREVFTASLAVVDQDAALFDDTIENNIKMWDASIEDFAMICAARDAGMHETIMQRKDGYRHKLVKGGMDLSGGQRQRLEIARVLAQDPTVVVLDEATSALDAATEAEVVAAIAKRGVTSIVIAHRLSTIRDADEIIVLDRGRVIERGTHDALFARAGVYARLVSNE